MEAVVIILRGIFSLFIMCAFVLTMAYFSLRYEKEEQNDEDSLDCIHVSYKKFHREDVITSTLHTDEKHLQN